MDTVECMQMSQMRVGLRQVAPAARRGSCCHEARAPVWRLVSELATGRARCEAGKQRDTSPACVRSTDASSRLTC